MQAPQADVDQLHATHQIRPQDARCKSCQPCKKT
jgi:hypothetical protein